MLQYEMPAAGVGLTANSLAVLPIAWSLNIAKNLEHFTNFCVILAQRPGWSSLYRSNFNICVAVASTLPEPCTWMPKCFSLARQTLLVVALKYRSFASSLRYHVATRDACSRSCLNITWAKRQYIHVQPYLLTVWLGCYCIITWYR